MKSTLPLLKGLKLKFITGQHSKGGMLRGPQFIGKSICGPQFTRKVLKKTKLDQTLFFVLVFWDVRGPHKCI